MSSPFSTGVRPPPSQMPPPQQAPPPPPPQPPAAPAETITGRVLGTFAKGPLCTLHFPAPPELTRLAHGASYGRPAPFVGTGDPVTALACACSALPWRLGDHLVHISVPCLTGAHERCLDKACQCECAGGDAARAIAAAADNSLADALRQISAAFTGRASDEDLAELEALRARVRALEGAVPATAETAAATCAGTRADGEPCQAAPARGTAFCARHQDQQNAG